MMDIAICNSFQIRNLNRKKTTRRKLKLEHNLYN